MIALKIKNYFLQKFSERTFKTFELFFLLKFQHLCELLTYSFKKHSNTILRKQIFNFLRCRMFSVLCITADGLLILVIFYRTLA